ncbi:MAG: hypothetical protein ABSC94_18090 [Polyangiaceae bacterium]|jgi:hypothetical protein
MQVGVPYAIASVFCANLLLGRSASAEEAARDCAAWDATFTIVGTLRITDTPMGAGDGVHSVGPGKLVLRIEEGGGDASRRHVELRAFELAERFSVEPKALLFRATIVTQVMARASADASGVMARGTLEGSTVRWQGPIHGYRTDGVLRCSGSLCGQFGAPPAGESAIHSLPHDVQLQPLRFGGSGANVLMGTYALVQSDPSPSQKAFIAFAGHATSWICVRPRETP